MSRLLTISSRHPPASARGAHGQLATVRLGELAGEAAAVAVFRRPHVARIQARAERLAAATGLDVQRLLGWCAAFAGMTALELASQGDGPGPRIEALRRLAVQAPTG